jgi:hypothetical protein
MRAHSARLRRPSAAASAAATASPAPCAVATCGRRARLDARSRWRVSLGAGPPGRLAHLHEVPGLRISRARVVYSSGAPAPRADRRRAPAERAPGVLARGAQQPRAIACAVRKGRPCSRTSVSASSVSVVPPSPRAPRAAPRRTPRRASRPPRASRRAWRRGTSPATSGCRSSSVSTMSPKGVLCTASITRLRLAERLAADGARVLERHRVPLLRHDAARLHEPVAQAQVAELHRAPEQQVLHDPAEAGEQHRRRRRALEQVVHRRDAAVGVARRAVEAEQLARAARGRSGSRCP